TMTTPAIPVLDRLLDAVSRCLNPDAARALINLRADPETQRRIDELADKCNEGLLSPEERSQYEAYVSFAAHGPNSVANLNGKPETAGKSGRPSTASTNLGP